MNPRVTSVKPLEKYHLFLEFSNGEKKIYDCSHLLNFGIFSQLKNPLYFKKVKASAGSVDWNNTQDICPDTLYIDSVPA
jgi:hypothetical protein